MSSLATELLPQAMDVVCTEDELQVSLSDGRKISAPIAWFPRLAHASVSNLARYELLGGGAGIHWPELDEDISVAGLLAGRPSFEYHAG
jgi:hypothetical protein